jgi:hypothetical protein
MHREQLDTAVIRITYTSIHTVDRLVKSSVLHCAAAAPQGCQGIAGIMVHSNPTGKQRLLT